MRIATGTPTYVGVTNGEPAGASCTSPAGRFWSATVYAGAIERSGPLTSACAILSATPAMRAPATIWCRRGRARGRGNTELCAERTDRDGAESRERASG